MSNRATAFERALQEIKEIRRLGTISTLLMWDEQVLLPEGAAAGRAEQLKLLAELIHEKRTHPQLVETLAEAAQTAGLNVSEQAIVREATRDVQRALKLPRELVGALSQAESRTYAIWVKAREGSSYKVVLEPFRELLNLKKEQAQALAEGRSLYDALLDLYEPGLTERRSEETFAALQPGLRELLAAIKEQGPVPKNPATDRCGKSEQQAFCRFVAETMQFDFRRGRLDEAVHPFCLDAGFADIRLTSRWSDEDFAIGLYGTMHEAGHGLYEQGFLPEFADTPLAEACSLGVHESQSRLWENMVGRSRPFMRFLHPRLQERFPAAFGEVSESELYRYVTRVELGLNRVAADEVSYGLHVIIRFHLERALIQGDLTPDDLPGAWDEAYTKELGMTPPNELVGVLQDIHWYIGAIGYFPTYLLGSVYAAQLFAVIEAQSPGLEAEIASGRLGTIKAWLNGNVHRHGRMYDAEELLTRACGVMPTAGAFLEYLRNKYLEPA